MLLLSILVASTFASETIASADLISTSYSLDAIVAPEKEIVHAVALLPFEPRNAEGDDIGPVAQPRRISADNIADLVRRVIAPAEWEAPGRSFEIVNRGESRYLAVRAPAAVQAEVKRCLAFLGSHFRRSVRVFCSAYSITRPIDGIESIVGASDPDSLIAGWKASGSLATVLDSEVTSLAGVPAIRNRIVERSYLVDYDSEIAESAATHDAISQTAQLGTVVALRADPLGADEVLVQFAVRNADEKGRRMIDASARVEYAIESRLAFERRAPGYLEAPEIEFQTLAGTARIGKGAKGVAFVAPNGTEDDGSHGLLVTFELAALAPAAAQFESEGRVLTIVDLGYGIGPSLRIPALSPSAGSMRAMEERRVWSGIASAIGIGHASAIEGEVDGLSDLAVRLGAELPESATLELVSGYAIAVSTTPVSAGLVRAAASLFTPPPTATLLGIVTGEPGSSSPSRAAFAVPMAGTSFLALCGIEENLLVGSDVDVAKGVSISSPVVATMLFGRFLSGAINSDSSGGETVDLSGFGRIRLSAIETFAHNSAALPLVERVESCSSRFSAAFEFAPQRASDRITEAFPISRESTLDLELHRIGR